MKQIITKENGDTVEVVYKGTFTSGVGSPGFECKIADTNLSAFPHFPPKLILMAIDFGQVHKYFSVSAEVVKEMIACLQAVVNDLDDLE